VQSICQRDVTFTALVCDLERYAPRDSARNPFPGTLWGVSRQRSLHRLLLAAVVAVSLATAGSAWATHASPRLVVASFCGLPGFRSVVAHAVGSDNLASNDVSSDPSSCGPDGSQRGAHSPVFDHISDENNQYSVQLVVLDEPTEGGAAAFAKFASKYPSIYVREPRVDGYAVWWIPKQMSLAVAVGPLYLLLITYSQTPNELTPHPFEDIAACVVPLAFK
jgi:hypothetical protein